MKQQHNKQPMQPRVKTQVETTPSHAATHHHDFAWRAFMFCKKNTPKPL